MHDTIWADLEHNYLCIFSVFCPEILVQVLAYPGCHLEHSQEDEEGSQQHR